MVTALSLVCEVALISVDAELKVIATRLRLHSLHAKDESNFQSYLHGFSTYPKCAKVSTLCV